MLWKLLRVCCLLTWCIRLVATSVPPGLFLQCLWVLGQVCVWFLDNECQLSCRSPTALRLEWFRDRTGSQFVLRDPNLCSCTPICSLHPACLRICLCARPRVTLGSTQTKNHSLHRLSYRTAFILFWSILDLQCCVNFCCIVKWFSVIYTYICILFYILFHYGLSQGIEYSGASLVAQMVKNLPAMQETWVQSLSWDDPLEKEVATHSSILAWRIPWKDESGGLQSIRLQRVRCDWATMTFIEYSSLCYTVGPCCLSILYIVVCIC